MTSEIAKGHRTPFYYYDLNLLSKTLELCKEESSRYGYTVHYALKANTDPLVLSYIRNAGFGADCVSGNEVKKAIESGFKNKEIVFAGVGKSDEEIIYSLEHDISCFNCESSHEIRVINQLAQDRGLVADIALRINPNVNAYTHHYITTGLEENKFGINLWEIDSLLQMLTELKHVNLKGLHFHIGSQITDMGVFKSLCIKVNEIVDLFRQKRIMINDLNMGGGLGINYHEPDKDLIPDFKTYFGLFNEFLNVLPGQKIHFELGRSLVGQCGTLVSRVLYIKNGINTNFAILDAGMTELIRPALYQSFHKIQNLSKAGQPEDFKYDVVGPICESSDCFGKSVMLPETERGDIVAIRTAGAYGEVMSSSYNLRERAETVYTQ